MGMNDIQNLGASPPGFFEFVFDHPDLLLRMATMNDDENKIHSFHGHPNHCADIFELLSFCILYRGEDHIISVFVLLE